MEPARVFVDTNIIRSATEETSALRPEVRAGKHCSKGKPDREVTFVTPSWTLRPAPEPNSEELRLLREVSKLAESKVVNFCLSHEVRLELLFQPRVISLFYGADIQSFELVPSATDYREAQWPRFPDDEPGVYMSPGPVLKGFSMTLVREPERAAGLVAEFLLRLPDKDSLSHFDFRMFHASARASHAVPSKAASVLLPLLKKLGDERYLELLKMLEVSQLSDANRPNGYVDAFLLWTAELAGCTHFLTLERGLVDRHKHESMVAILPSQLLAELR